MSAQTNMRRLTSNLHVWVSLLKLLNNLLRGRVQSILAARVVFDLSDVDNQPIRERSVAAAVVHHTAFRREGHFASIRVAIFLPVVRIPQRVAICLVRR